jgi:hypothetical protein
MFGITGASSRIASSPATTQSNLISTFFGVTWKYISFGLECFVLFELFLHGILIFRTNVGYFLQLFGEVPRRCPSPNVEQIIDEFFLLARQVRCLNVTRFGDHSFSLRYRALVHHDVLSYFPDLREVPAHNCRSNNDQNHNTRDAHAQDPAASLLFVLLCKPFVPTITRQYPSFALPFVDLRVDILRINAGFSTLL